MLKNFFILPLFFVFLIARAAADPECENHGFLVNDEGWCVRKLLLEGDLAKIFTIPISRCQRISGLTCKIQYNGQLSLPSEVFFIELDSKGKRLGKPIRMIYPQLKKGETGYATFRIRSSDSSTIVLTGKWDGPWKDPY